MGMREGFENFVIDELGPYALNGGAMSIYEAVKKAWQAATLQAAERMKEEAAKVCESKELAFNIDVWISSTKKEMTAHTANGLADAIRAIDVNKLFGD